MRLTPNEALTTESAVEREEERTITGTPAGSCHYDRVLGKSATKSRSGSKGMGEELTRCQFCFLNGRSTTGAFTNEIAAHGDADSMHS